MLELHLFVNPLGMRCLRCEKDVLKIDRDLNTKISYQFVPLFNMKTIDNTLKYYHLNPHDLAIRQQVSKILNQVILDYKAALFQGRKRGRHYLLQLQSALINQGLDYNDELINKIAHDSHLDLEMFFEDRQSQLAKQAFRQDQKIASDLGVSETATAVVFNTEDSDYGHLQPGRIECLGADAFSVLYENTVAAVGASAHDKVGGSRLTAVGRAADDDAPSGIGIG